VSRMKRGEFNPTVSLLGAMANGNSAISSLLPRTTIMVTALNTLALAVNQGITDYFVPVFLKEAGYSATFVGTAATLKTTGLVLVRFGLGALTKSIGAFTLLFLGVATATAFMAAIPLFPVAPYILLAYFLTGAGSGMAPVLTSALIAEATSSTERGLGMAIDQTSSNTGKVASGLGFGAFAQVFGLSMTVLVGNGLVLIAMGGIVVLHRKLAGRSPHAAQG
jgi:MFS family permease